MRRPLSFTFCSVALVAIMGGADHVALLPRVNLSGAAVQPTAPAQTARQQHVLSLLDNSHDLP